MSFGYRTGRKVDGGKRSSLGLCPECGKRGLGKARPSHELSSATMLRDCRYCGHIHLVGVRVPDIVEQLLDQYDLRRLDTRDRESVRLALRAAILTARGQS